MAIENPKVKHALLSVAFYAVYYLAAFILGELVTSGAHVPGLGLLLVMITPVVAGGLLILNLIKYYFRKEVVGSVFVHLAVLVICFLLFAFLSF